MNDEEILRSVAERARDEDEKLAVLERVARGERVPESELAGIDAETLAMFRPIGAASEERIAHAITKTKLATVHPLRPWLRFVPLVAAAAAALIFFAWPRSGGSLPDYTFELSGNVATLRAGDPVLSIGRAKVAKSATFDLVLRPAQKVNQKVGITAALVRNGKAVPWSHAARISQEGAVRITGPVNTLFPDTDAPWDLVIAIGPEGSLPSNLESLVTAQSLPGCRLVRGTVEFAQ